MRDRAGAIRYEELFTHGMSTTQKQSIEWVPRGGKVLELGCSGGYIGALLRERKNCDVTGVEVDPDAVELARAKGLQVFAGSLDDKDFLAQLSGAYDMVLANDVLEHLVDPDRALARVLELLAPGGRIVISTPNIATWSVRSKLFFGGHFRYEEHGIMDRTHVHFFTWWTFHEMLERHDLRVDARAFETLEFPLVMDLFYHWPARLLDWAHGKTSPRWAPARTLSSALHARATMMRPRVALRICEHLPNLCVPHIIVLASPNRPVSR